MRKYIVFESEDESKTVEVNITFIIEVETEITKFNKTGKMGDNERVLDLLKCSVAMNLQCYYVGDDVGDDVGDVATAGLGIFGTVTGADISFRHSLHEMKGVLQKF